MAEKKHGEAVEVEGVTVKKPEKPLLPAREADGNGRAPGEEVIKQGLAEHYARVADVMLPHVTGRPISMQRFPDGLDGVSFYEKKLPSHYPDWVTSVDLATNDGRQRQVVIDDAATLALLAQSACLTPHVWLSRADGLGGVDTALDRPDLLIVDLDPSTDDVAAVREAAQIVREALDGLGLRSWVKTTGSRGYHVTVPLRRDRGFDEVRDFAQRLAAVLAQRRPDLLTVEARKENRGERVLLDVARNAYAQTVVPPYAVRPAPGGPVATPIRWDELTRVLPDQHTIASLPRRLGQVEDPWADLWDHRQTLGSAIDALARWEE